LILAISAQDFALVPPLVIAQTAMITIYVPMKDVIFALLLMEPSECAPIPM